MDEERNDLNHISEEAEETAPEETNAPAWSLEPKERSDETDAAPETAAEDDGSVPAEEQPGDAESDETADAEAPADEAAEAADETNEEELTAEEAIEEEPPEEEPAAEADGEAEETAAEAFDGGEIPAEEAAEAESVDETEESEKPLDGIALGCDLCNEVLASVGKDGFHGGVRPDNITVREDGVTLGSRLEHGVGEFTPQELEFMAPELFWDGLRTPAADVYSLGLILYSLYNGGRMPFWPEEGEITPNIRAASLQKRMSQEEIAPPADAGEELSAIILRSLAFDAAERWYDAEELRNALGDCQEEEHNPTALTLAMAGLVTRQAAAAEPGEEFTSPFVEDVDEINGALEEEEPLPQVRVRRTRRAGKWIVVALLAVVAAALLLMHSCGKTQAPAPTPTPTPETEEDGDGVKIINGNQTDTYTPEPEPTPIPTPEPTETPAVVEYVAVQENVSWNEAVQRCISMGGELAMPANYAEFQEITRACEDAGLTYAWLGARRDVNGDWVTTTGEEAVFFAWGDGEPSVVDSGDGTAEDYYLLWNMNGRWCGNDSRENPLDGFWGTYAGRIGYVCKLVTYETQETGENG